MVLGLPCLHASKYIFFWSLSMFAGVSLKSSIGLEPVSFITFNFKLVILPHALISMSTFAVVGGLISRLVLSIFGIVQVIPLKVL